MLPFLGVIEQVQFEITSMNRSVGERVTASGYRLRELQSLGAEVQYCRIPSRGPAKWNQK